jgi:hypothetical protein
MLVATYDFSAGALACSGALFELCLDKQVKAFCKILGIPQRLLRLKLSEFLMSKSLSLILLSFSIESSRLIEI